MKRLFDRLAHREVRWRGRAVRSFQLCGLAGLAMACALAAWLAGRLGLSPWILGGLASASVATFLVLAMVAKILIGRETLIYYHHEIAVFAVTAAILSWRHLPVLSYLDVIAIGMGAVLAAGRVGCLMAACCHGRPHAWGVRYSWEYVADGFCERYAAVPLFPIQMVESAGVAALVAICCGVALSGRARGSAFLLYVSVYAAMRFVFEFFRGDAERRFWLEFSEAQWTSCLLGSAALARQSLWACALPPMMAAAGWALRRFGEQRRLFRPSHLIELAAALDRSRAARGAPAVVTTSMGVRLSTGHIHNRNAVLTNYSISRAGSALGERNARALCAAAALIDGAEGPGGQWIRGSDGVFHLIIGGPQ